MTRPLRYGSVCSGVGTCALAWHELGWTTAFFSEIEPFPSAVLKHHWPDVPNVGDFTTMRRDGWGIDLLAGGCPCQSFSLAGLRKGLTDDRGNLTLQFIRLADDIDDAQVGGLPFIVYENVPGILSDKTNAFGCFLAGLCGADEPLALPGGGSWANSGVVAGPRRTAAWRICDAQYWGVAQRRRRVIVVASPRTSGVCPATLLLELDRVRRDHPPGRPTGADAAGTLMAGAQGRGWRESADDAAAGHIVIGALSASDGGADGDDAAAGRLITQAFGGNNLAPLEVATTCNAKGGTGRLDFESETFVVNGADCQHGGGITHPLTTNCGIATENCMGNGNGAPLIPVQKFVVPINEIGKRCGVGASKKDGTGIGQPGDPAFAVAYDPNQVTSATNRSNPKPGDPCHTLPAKGDAPMVVLDDPALAFSSKGDGGDAGALSPTVRAAGHSDSHANAGCPPAVCVTGSVTHALKAEGADASEDGTGRGNPITLRDGLTVRRLTPRECERLQGYPDDHTLVPFKSRVAKDDALALFGYWGPELMGRILGKQPADVTVADASLLAADGPRYRAIGNGWAMPVFRWVGARIQQVVDARAR